MKKYLSYIWPITKKISSDQNGVLELSWVNGKKVLDSKNSNYSYGAIDGALDFAFSKIDFTNVHDILLLGLGAGNAIELIFDKYGFNGELTAVEIDPAIIEISKDEFGLTEKYKIEIINKNAFEFIENSPKPYDLIVIDLSIDDKVPFECYSSVFWKKIFNLTTDRAYLIFNAGMNKSKDYKIDKLITNQTRFIDFKLYSNVSGIYSIVIGKCVNLSKGI